MYENDNDTPSPDIYSSEMLKELDKRTKNIRFAVTRMDVDIEKASVNLYWVYSTKAYKAMGHESIIDYAMAEFDISKSTTYNYITLAERFGHRGEDDKFLFDGFDEKYKPYSSSKLNLLAPFTDEDIEHFDIKPEMSVRDIKKRIKESEKYLPSDRFKKPQEKDFLNNAIDNLKSIIENSKKNDAPEDDDNEPADDMEEDDEADDDGIIGYSFETIQSFNLEEFSNPGFSNYLIKIIRDAFKLYSHPDVRIEINVRYPVVKQTEKSDLIQEFSKFGTHVYI